MVGFCNAAARSAGCWRRVTRWGISPGMASCHGRGQGAACSEGVHCYQVSIGPQPVPREMNLIKRQLRILYSIREVMAPCCWGEACERDYHFDNSIVSSSRGLVEGQSRAHSAGWFPLAFASGRTWRMRGARSQSVRISGVTGRIEETARHTLTRFFPLPNTLTRCP